MNRTEEIRAFGGLTGDTLAGTVRVVEDVHRAVGDRVHAALPPVARSISTVVRASTTATYATVRGAHRWIPRGVAAVGAARTSPDAGSLLDSPASDKAVAFVNGILGSGVTDRVDATTPMLMFHQGAALPVDEVADLVDARPHLVLFVHGLVETEADWNRQPRDRVEWLVPYPEQLPAELPVTTLSVRYATGHAVGENGSQLADLLETVARQWPVPLSGITLVGHSMGGLVARSAAHLGHLQHRDWVSRLRLIVTLGTPHLGAPMSKAVDLAERALGRFPESAPIGRALFGGRSAGVRDLSEGRIVVGSSPYRDPPAVPGVTHCTIGSTFTQDLNHPVGVLIGDGLVRLPSAAGRDRVRALDFQVDTRLGGMHHLTVLNSPEVYQLVRGWLEEFALT